MKPRMKLNVEPVQYRIQNLCLVNERRRINLCAALGRRVRLLLRVRPAVRCGEYNVPEGDGPDCGLPDLTAAARHPGARTLTRPGRGLLRLLARSSGTCAPRRSAMSI